MLDVDLSEDIARISGALENERNDHRSTREKLKGFEGIDPEIAKQLLAEQRKNADKKLIDAGKVDELVAQRVDELRKSYDAQIAELKKGNEGLQGQLSKELIDNRILLEAKGAGVRDTAIDDVLLRGRQIFSLKEGKVIALDGDKPIYNKEGRDLGIGDWVRGSLLEKAPHLYNNPSGSGSNPGSGQGGNGAQADGFKISRTDARDTIKYSAAKEAAAKAGVGVVIVD